MKTIITLREYNSKRWPILAECIPLGYSGVYSNVAEAMAKIAERFGNVEVRNLTSKN